MNRQVSDTEHRLILLTALDALGPVTTQQALVFLVENDLSNYFAMHLALYDLTEAGWVTRIGHAIGLLYVLTPTGHETLAQFGKRLPLSVRKTIESQSTLYRRRFSQEKQRKAEVYAIAGGLFGVRLQLMEHDGAVMDLSLTVASHDEAERIAARWRGSASQEIYQHILAALTGDWTLMHRSPYAQDRTPAPDEAPPHGATPSAR